MIRAGGSPSGDGEGQGRGHSLNRLIPDATLAKWQRIVDLMARVLEVPAALITRVGTEQLEVLLASDSEGNPYVRGGKEDLDTGLLCEAVMARRQKLLVPDAPADPEWDHNPAIELGMTFYLGYPICWPSGEVFGTICVLDGKQNPRATDYEKLVEEFRDVVQADLEWIVTERRLAVAIEASGAGIYDHSVPLGPDMYHSERWAEILGYTLDELPPPESYKEWLTERIHPEDLPRLRTAYSDFIEGRTPGYKVEVRMKRKDGWWAWVTGHSKAVSRDEGGRVTRVTGVMLDITDWKMAEHSLILSEAKNRALVASLPDMMFRLSADGTYLEFIPGKDIEPLVPPQEFLGKRIVDVMPAELAEQTMRDIGRALDSGAIQSCEYPLTISEEELHYEYRIVPCGDDEVLGMVRDISERKRAERKLRELNERLERRVRERTVEIEAANNAQHTSERRAQLYLEIAGSMIFVVEADGTINLVNRRGCEVLGREADEIVGKHFETFVPEPDREGALERFAAMVEGKPRGRFESYITRPDGTSRLIGWYGSSVRDEEGRIVQFLFAGEDITERKQAEQAVKDSRQRLIKAERVARMGFLEWNLKTNEIVWSREVYELYGIEPGTPVTLEGTVGLVHPDDLEFVNKSLDLAIRGVLSYDIDHRMVRPDGKVIWVHARADLERDSEGVPTFLHGTVVDITERKLAEEGLKESEERFRNLMEQSPLAMVIFTPEGQITEVNAAWMRLWGLNGEQAAEAMANYNIRTDKQLEDLGWAPLVERGFAGECVVLPPIEYSGNLAVEEMGLEGIEANSRWVQSHLYSVKDANGDITYVVNAVADITELKRAEREAREQRDALARVDRATRMGQLTGSIAHELNQPLTGILSNAQAAEMMIESGRWDRGDLAKIMTEIAADAKRTGDVIRNLRELYREQKGEFTAVDVNNVVDEVTELLHSEFVIQDAEVTTDCAPSIPPVNGNRVQIEQVLVNLLVNGIQAVSDGERDDRRLRVATVYDASEVKAWVEDSGPGIDEDKIDRIFEPLATWKPGGTGMGLAVSNSIIEAHGGKMWAENRPEGGARVGFALPVLKHDRQA
jgi:PAS domain S-box-containing protein